MNEEIELEIDAIKALRGVTQTTLEQMEAMGQTQNRLIAISKLREAILWMGMALIDLGYTEEESQ